MALDPYKIILIIVMLATFAYFIVWLLWLVLNALLIPILLVFHIYIWFSNGMSFLLTISCSYTVQLFYWKLQIIIHSPRKKLLIVRRALFENVSMHMCTNIITVTVAGAHIKNNAISACIFILLPYLLCSLCSLARSFACFIQSFFKNTIRIDRIELCLIFVSRQLY